MIERRTVNRGWNPERRSGRTIAQTPNGPMSQKTICVFCLDTLPNPSVAAAHLASEHPVRFAS